MNEIGEVKKANFGMAELEANWVEFVPINDKIGPIRLLLRPLSGKERAEFQSALESSDRGLQVEVLTKILVDWNLENASGPIPCNEQTKKQWGDRLAHLRVKLSPDLFTEDQIAEPENKVGTFLGTQAVIFAGRPENFLKN